MKSLKQLLVLFLAALMGGVVSVALYRTMGGDQSQPNPFSDTYPQAANYQINNVTVPTFDFADISEAITPTVVHITTTAATAQRQHERSPFDFFQERGPRQGSGSGVIVSNDGYIVTNNHVIERASKIEVTLLDKRVYTADIIGIDPNTDLALLKIKETGLPFIRLGNSDQVRVGEWVLAVGNPFNLTSTVTAGIVSAKGRNINLLGGGHAIEAFIQTDAAVNPGNSGGALVNTRGELVGINTAIATQTGTYSGYSFAVPVNIVKKVMTDLIEFGAVQRGFIGVSIRDVDAEVARKEKLPRVSGVLIEELTDGGAAADAGLKKGDIILRINDVVVNTVPELQEIVSRYRPGDQVQVVYWRGGKERDTKVILRNRDGRTDLVSGEIQNLRNLLGANFEQASSEILEKNKLNNGVIVNDIRRGKLRDIGIENGFIITRINRKNVHTPSDVINTLKENKDAALIEGVHSNGTRGVYALTLE